MHIDPTRRRLERLATLLWLLIIPAVVAAGCHAPPSSAGEISLIGDDDAGQATNQNALTRLGVCPHDTEAACDGWRALRDAYSGVFGVPLSQASPERWISRMALSSSSFTGGASARGRGPDGNFSYYVYAAEEITNVVRDRLDADGIDTSEFDDFGLHFFAVELGLESVPGSGRPFEGVVLSHDLPVPGADPNYPAAFAAAVAGNPASYASSSCSTNPDDYSCPPLSPPSCTPTCDTDPVDGRVLDAPMFADKADEACDEYKSAMSGACSAHDARTDACDATLAEAKRKALEDYTFAMVLCAVSIVFTWFSFGAAQAICTAAAAGRAAFAYERANNRHTGCLASSARTLDSDKAKAAEDRTAAYTAAIDDACHLPCPPISDPPEPPQEPEPRDR